MRFYDIIITKSDGTVFVPPSMQGFLTASSYSSLTPSKLGSNPNALDLYVDIPEFFASAPREGARITLSGVSLQDIAQTTHLVDASIKVYGGMLDGYLPLSKRYKPDLLVDGTIWQTSGNWEGVNTTLDIVVTTPITRNPALTTATGTGNVNLGLNWLVGQPLSGPLTDLLTNAYGKANNPKGGKIVVSISPKVVAKAPFTGSYDSMQGFSNALQVFTRDSFKNTITRLDGSPYRGVRIYWKDNTVYAVDGTQPGQGSGNQTASNPIQINYTDLIGQPVWKTANELVFKVVMRGDIELEDHIKLPQGINTPFVGTAAGTSQAPNTSDGMTLPSKDSTIFTGVFEVQEIRHSGQFRQAGGMGWTTTIDCFVPANPNQSTILTTGTAPAPTATPTTTPTNPADPFATIINQQNPPLAYPPPIPKFN